MKVNDWEINPYGHFSKDGYIIKQYIDSREYFIKLPDGSFYKREYTTLHGAFQAVERLIKNNKE